MPEKKYMIVLADDDADDMELLESTFKKIDKNIQIKCVSDGNCLISYLGDLNKEELPGLIIIDYNMPGMNGAEVLISLRQIGRYDNIPKLIYSTSADPVNVKECMENGANHYFTKPWKVEELHGMAQQLLSYANSNLGRD